MTDQKFHGIYPMIYAFFGPDGRLDRAAMKRQVEACVASGVHGVAILGIVTEFNKLDVNERRQVIEWTAEDLAGRLPLAVTANEMSIHGQIEIVKLAAEVQADWVILQPPPVRNVPESELVRFFGKVADAAPLPVAIQNAPQYLGRGLSAEDVARLMRRHANMTLIKAEGSAVEVERLIATTEGKLRVFNGRGGLEMIDSLRAGCDGFLLAPDAVDHAVAIHRLYQAGDEAAAAAAYARAAPSIVFVMQSIETLICYGKRLFAARAGLTVHDRAPALRPTEFGLDLVARHAAALGPFGLKG